MKQALYLGVLGLRRQLDAGDASEACRSDLRREQNVDVTHEPGELDGGGNPEMDSMALEHCEGRGISVEAGASKHLQIEGYRGA